MVMRAGVRNAETDRYFIDEARIFSRGPGATNVSIGVHVAQQDAVPLVLFIGQVGRADLGPQRE